MKAHPYIVVLDHGLFILTSEEELALWEEMDSSEMVIFSGHITGELDTDDLYTAKDLMEIFE